MILGFYLASWLGNLGGMTPIKCLVLRKLSLHISDIVIHAISPQSCNIVPDAMIDLGIEVRTAVISQ